MTSIETLKLVARKGLVLLFALIVIIASAGCINFGVQPGNGLYIPFGILNLGIAGYALYKLFKTQEKPEKPKDE